MLNFDYCNSTHYVYGPGEHRRVGSLLRPLATGKVLLHYGGGSIIRSGLLDTIRQSLSEAQIDFIELGGVKPNPSVSLVRTGITLCKQEQVSLVLAVGGGSVIDSAKGIAVGATNTCDVWELYSRKGSIPEHNPLPVAVVLTLPAAGSENSPNTVLSDEETGRKLGFKHMGLRPALSIVDPSLFLTLPREQMAYGACDMMCHIFERYFTNTPHTELTDALAEATMRTIMAQSRRLNQNLQNTEAWGQLALSGTIAHNDLLGLGREQSWACHALEHELSAVYDVPHGGGLAVVVPAYMKAIWKYNPGIFAQWATNVMGVEPHRDTEAVIQEGIARLEAWYTELGLPRNMKELGIPADADFAAMAHAACRVYGGGAAIPTLAGVHPITAEEATAIYQSAI
jgi:alcohol dehydrogenase YqhD (iron-dependent ADH family)